MECPKCHVALVPAVRHQLAISLCPSCQGMWFARDELDQLENEVFDFGDRWKGSLVFSSSATTDKCPECPAMLRSFQYRFYDVQMELCPNQHGYWLTRNEDDRVLALMKQEEGELRRKLLAEDKWSRTLKHLRSRSFFARLRDLF